MFVEEVTIEDVNEVGCLFKTRIHLETGDIIAIKQLVPGKKSLPDEQRQLFEIAWDDCRTTFWAVGAKKLQGEKLAKIKFPPANY